MTQIEKMVMTLVALRFLEESRAAKSRLGVVGVAEQLALLASRTCLSSHFQRCSTLEMVSQYKNKCMFSANMSGESAYNCTTS